MHGAHPARLAFKLRDLSLFLLRTFLPPSPSRIADRSLSLFLSLNVVEQPPFQQFSSYVTEPRVLLLHLLFPSPFYFSPRSGVIRKRTCLRALARGGLMGKTDTTAGSRANCLAGVNRDSAKTLNHRVRIGREILIIKMQRCNRVGFFRFFFFFFFVFHSLLVVKIW